MMAALARARAFTEEVVDEIKKVTWPDVPELRSRTIAIMIFVIIVALIIWLMDVSVSWILRSIIGLFAG